MKTYNKIIIAIILSVIIVAAYGQKNPAKNQRPSYKEIQKVSQKQSEDETLNTVVSVGYQVWTVSKRVQVTSNRYDRDVERGNVVSKGTPHWVISKGVHQHRAKKEVRKSDSPSKPQKGDDIVKKDSLR